MCIVPREADLFKVPESPGNLRPDIVVLNRTKNTATIVDVMIPFEMDETAYAEARKYQPLKTRLEEEGGYQRSLIHAFIVGTPGFVGILQQ